MACPAWHMFAYNGTLFACEPGYNYSNATCSALGAGDNGGVGMFGDWQVGSVGASRNQSFYFLAPVSPSTPSAASPSRRPSSSRPPLPPSSPGSPSAPPHASPARTPPARSASYARASGSAASTASTTPTTGRWIIGSSKQPDQMEVAISMTSSCPRFGGQSTNPFLEDS